MSLSRKRKKELRKLQDSANKLWESQQVIVGEAAGIAREASRQLGKFGSEQVVPAVNAKYSQHVAPVFDNTAKAFDSTAKFSKHVYEDRVVPTVGGVVGSALSVWDAANDQRHRIANGRGVDVAAFRKKVTIQVPEKKGPGVGSVIAIVLGVVAAAGVLYAAWQTLRADDELWVADDPLRAPDA